MQCHQGRELEANLHFYRSLYIQFRISIRAKIQPRIDIPEHFEYPDRIVPEFILHFICVDVNHGSKILCDKYT